MRIVVVPVLFLLACSSESAHEPSKAVNGSTAAATAVTSSTSSTAGSSDSTGGAGGASGLDAALEDATNSAAGGGGATGTGGAMDDARASVPSDATDAALDGSRDSGDAAVHFSPCPARGSPCAIMPLGDSITFADLAPGAGYRVELYHQALVNAQNITFVGSQMNGPPTVDGKPFPNQSEGHSGYVISGSAIGISELADASLARYKPHIVLLMIGTNDVDRAIDLPNAPKRLAALLDQILRDAPDTLLVVAKITPTMIDAKNTRVQAYNAAIGPLVQERAAAGKHIAMVDMYAALTANASYKTELLRDELHPTLAGYQVIGRTWYAALRDLLPAQP
jgi:lysophospholipase L1-like esterase